MGQVINFGRDEDDKFVLADSFGAFMEWMVAQLQAGNFLISDDTSDGHTDFALKDNPESHFTDVAKGIFAPKTEK